MMTATMLPLARVLASSARKGASIEPTALRVELERRTDPLGSLTQLDDYNSAWDALASEFPSMWDLTQSRSEIDDQMIARLAGLVRWIIKEVCTWPEQDSSQVRLGTLLVAAKFCAPYGGLWSVIATRGPSVGFVAQLEKLLRSVRTIFTARLGLPAPINEVDAVAGLEVAERDRDWVAILAQWPRFEFALSINDVLGQAIEALASIAPDALLRSLAAIDQFTMAVTILNALPDPDVAAASENPFIQFALIHLAGSLHPRQTARFSVSEDRLVDVLVRSAQDLPRWKAWMVALNQFPSRYPRLQRVLGLALAQLPEGALAAYINALRLNASSGASARDSVDAGLQAFRAIAGPDQRRRLWSLAYERWAEWNFGVLDRLEHLTNIGTSELDYAVVGYAVECLDDQGRQGKIDESLGRISAAKTTWFSDVVAFHTEWLRAVSSLQPFAHAQHVVGSGGDWLSGGRLSLPFDPNEDIYSAVESGWDRLARLYR